MKSKIRFMFMVTGAVAYCALCWSLLIFVAFGYSGLVIGLLTVTAIAIYLFYHPKFPQS